MARAVYLGRTGALSIKILAYPPAGFSEAADAGPLIPWGMYGPVSPSIEYLISAHLWGYRAQIFTPVIRKWRGSVDVWQRARAA